MYQHPTIAETSYNAVQDVIGVHPIPPAYRAEYNPLSGRWMVLSEFDVCIQAGLSKGAAMALAESL